MNIADILNAMTPELYRKFQVAIETGKWPNGNKLSATQKQICMQAVIVYEHKYVADNEKTGVVERTNNQCENDSKNNKVTELADSSNKIKLTHL